jgi:hypothetical protein
MKRAFWKNNHCFILLMWNCVQLIVNISTATGYLIKYLEIEHDKLLSCSTELVVCTTYSKISTATG